MVFHNTISSSNLSNISDDWTCFKSRSNNLTLSNSHQEFTSEDLNFNEAFNSAKEAIDAGVYPQLIPNGSSGSYFVKNMTGEIVGIFKPKDEEPFASLNPKWPKFFQKMLCFCCFGRACLIPNHGYLSETAASYIDIRLELGIVPITKIVKLSSPTFYYGQRCGRPSNPKPKEGSFQLFVKDYQSATDVLSEWNFQGVGNVLTLTEIRQFTVFFQKMCVLDYVIRNTDRHMDNWLIKYVPENELKIAAIDNGLAFPIKHPESASRFRHFPFDWSTLSWAYKPWDDQLREILLSKLTPFFVEKLCHDLMILFRLDKTHNRMLTRAQLRVVRGQLWNLHESLLSRESPFALVKRTPVIVSRRYHGLPLSNDWSKCFRVKFINSSSRMCC